MLTSLIATAAAMEYDGALVGSLDTGAGVMEERFTGPDLAVRVGYRATLGRRLVLEPEIGLRDYRGTGMNLFAPHAGLRVGVDLGRVTPALYGHWGVAVAVAALWDVGAAVDLDVTDHVAVGLHAGVNVLDVDEVIGPTVGAHVRFSVF